MVGRYGEAVTRGRALLSRARATGAVNVAAFSGYYLALAIWEIDGATDEVFSVLRQAVRDADQCGDAELSLRTRIRLFDALNDGRGLTDQAEEVALDAEAWLNRLGHPAHLELLFVQARGTLLSRQRRHDEAATLLRRAIALNEEVHGARSPLVANAYDTLGIELSNAGHLFQAVEAFQTSVRLLQAARWRSPTQEVLTWGNLAGALLEVGRAGEAMEALGHAEAALGPQSADLKSYAVWLKLQRAVVLEDLNRVEEADRLAREVLADPVGVEADDLSVLYSCAARLQVALGKPEQARPLAERALQLADDHEAASSTRAEAAFALAQALWGTGEKARSIELARDALAAYAGPDYRYLRSKVEQWLAAHPAGAH